MPSIVVAGVQDGSTPGGDISTIVGVPYVPCTALRGYKGELVAVIPRPGGIAVTRVRRGVADAIQCTVGSVGAECCRASREEEDKGDDCDDGLYPHLIIDNLFSRRFTCCLVWCCVCFLASGATMFYVLSCPASFARCSMCFL